MAGLLDFERQRCFLVPRHAGHIDHKVIDVFAVGHRLGRGADLQERPWNEQTAAFRLPNLPVRITAVSPGPSQASSKNASSSAGRP